MIDNIRIDINSKGLVMVNRIVSERMNNTGRNDRIYGVLSREKACCVFYFYMDIQN
ncbi:hypothetical protein SAMN04488121_103808 [Chitinophaga filiformis]|uniref:Uncharacterized protein n=1 Tax=Chitinophaga filiformis TaxID=104663 RepID=A0A1G7SD35_CHIFI|nr:hypothetical protein SAMN04488121_103808 [Chitinophaga filiformis]